MTTQRDKTTITADSLDQLATRIDGILSQEIRRLARKMREQGVPEAEVTGYATILDRVAYISGWLPRADQAINRAAADIMKSASQAIKAAGEGKKK